MALNMLHSSRGSPKFPVIFWQFSSLKSEDLLRLPNSLPVTDPERRRNTGSPFAASSLKAAAEKCPAAPHENSFALKFTTLVTFRTERALQTPVLRSPQPRGAVHLPSRHQGAPGRLCRGWPEAAYLWSAQRQAQVFPSSLRRQPARTERGAAGGEWQHGPGARSRGARR